MTSRAIRRQSCSPAVPRLGVVTVDDVSWLPAQGSKLRNRINSTSSSERCGDLGSGVPATPVIPSVRAFSPRTGRFVARTA
jgi:phosphatidylserine/phosphatidylglycerophosphate/cardiolipin synthase-like enzyme